jgi:hypothetical protein
MGVGFKSKVKTIDTIKAGKILISAKKPLQVFLKPVGALFLDVKLIINKMRSVYF